MTITPYAIACGALLLAAVFGTMPRWKVNARHRRLAADRADRSAEDRAWRNRKDDVALAWRLNYDRESMIGTGSLRVPDEGGA